MGPIRKSARQSSQKYKEEQLRKTPIKYRQVKRNAVNPRPKIRKTAKDFKLDELPQDMVYVMLKYFTNRDLFDISLISEDYRLAVWKSKRVVEIVKWTMNRSRCAIEVNFEENDPQKNVVVIIEVLDREDYEIFLEESEPVRVLNELVLMDREEANGTKTVYFNCQSDEQFKRLTVLVSNHLVQTLRVQQFVADIQLSEELTFKDIPFFDIARKSTEANFNPKCKTVSRTFRFLQIKSEFFDDIQVLEADEVKFLLDQVSVHELRIDTPIANDLIYSGKFKPAILRVSHGSWIQLNNIIGMESKIIDIERTNLSDNDCSEIVHSWMNKITNYEFIIIENNSTRFKKRGVMGTVRGERKVNFRRLPYYRNEIGYFPTNCRNCRNLHRQDGRSAFVQVYDTSFKMGVWEKLEENGISYYEHEQQEESEEDWSDHDDEDFF